MYMAMQLINHEKYYVTKYVKSNNTSPSIKHQVFINITISSKAWSPHLFNPIFLGRANHIWEILSSFKESSSCAKFHMKSQEIFQ